MRNPSKIGVILASAVAVAFLTASGCASQGSGAATAENLPNNCKAVPQVQNACKNTAGCKGKGACHSRHHHAKKAAKSSKVSTTETTTETSTEAK